MIKSPQDFSRLQCPAGLGFPLMKDQQFYSFSSYRDLLGQLLPMLLDQGKSYREIAKECGFKSPNILQQILAGKRNLTDAAAEKLAAGLQLGKERGTFLRSLVHLEHPSLRQQEKAMGEIKRQKQKVFRHQVSSGSIHEHWTYGLVLQLAGLPGFVCTPENVQKSLRMQLSKQEIEDAVQFLKKAGYLVPTEQEHVYQQKNVEFAVLNDIRRIDLQQSHLRYMDQCKMRINDDLEDREFQGLTVAIAKSQFAHVKEQIRQAMDAIFESLESCPQPKDEVIRVQMCAVKLTRPAS